MTASSMLRNTVLVGMSVLLLAACTEERHPTPALPRAVRVIEADPRAIGHSAQASGQIQPRYTSNVGFLVAGRLVSRNVDLGAVVKTGDLLARIDPVDFQNKIVAAQSQVAAAQADLDLATPEEARLRKLLNEGYTTRVRYEQALSALEGAKARMEGAQANLRLADDQMKYATLLAPTDGVVTATGADPGQVVSAGQMIVQIAKLEEREAVFAVSPQDAALAHPGMPVEVWLQDKPEERVSGTIREIAPSADPTTGTYTVKVTLPHPSPDMRLGAIVVGEATVAGGIVTRIPATALLQTGERPEVWVVSQSDSAVRKRPVKVLRYDADSVTVSEGLAKGDLVVIAGVNSLADGQKVALQRTSAP